MLTIFCLICHFFLHNQHMTFIQVEAISDRICIASGGKTVVRISAEDLLDCCHLCGFGCEGGATLFAWYSIVN